MISWLSFSPDLLVLPQNSPMLLLQLGFQLLDFDALREMGSRIALFRDSREVGLFPLLPSLVKGTASMYLFGACIEASETLGVDETTSIYGDWKFDIDLQAGEEKEIVYR